MFRYASHTCRLKTETSVYAVSTYGKAIRVCEVKLRDGFAVSTYSEAIRVCGVN
ncbi:MAG: hypothetical protein O8C64_00960 [Candidatus Methanoperedens sp.]|nr:hypothetical protein [Candidatus Methanoperedens sp.]MCZ7384488.1 hypothetical protein [Candidatus Methanoperedens sp.]MCZ7404791.1 hypothetical protein [Candidatus Methanoperedens sp.]